MVGDCPRPCAELTRLWLAGSPRSLHLPGSHGHVFPWDPPSFGVSDEVLVKLARKLQDEAIRLAIEDASEKVSRSRQSPPASVSDDDEDVFRPWITIK